MKIIVAPDNFKDSLSASQVASNIEAGIKKVMPEAEIVKMPLSDGGDGLVESLVSTTGGKIIKKEVTGPLGEETIEAVWGLLGDNETGVIEMAAASGIQLIPVEKRDASITTTYGTGELILDALDKKCSKIIIGIGGSASNDGGTGMASALGAFFYDQGGNILNIKGGKDLTKVSAINISEMDKRLREVEFLAACDVDNPLTGPKGATYVYGPQKGADKDTLDLLENGMKNYAAVIKNSLLKKIDLPGAGAGGGFGAGIYAFLDGKLKGGIELVMDAVGFDHKVEGARLIITGEGKLDKQSIFGKVPVGVAKRAKKQDIPVVALCGELELDADELNLQGIDACFSIINGPKTLEEAIKQSPKLLKETAAQVFRLFFIKP